MGRFDDRATRPIRGPGDIIKWKLGRRDATIGDHAQLDVIRPRLVGGGAVALRRGDACTVWIGHATWAFRLGGKLVVIDPVWSKRLGGAVSRLVPPGVEFDALPEPDIVLVTHDHRDHMDLPTLAKLPTTAKYITGLGNGARIAKPDVSELDWWESIQVDDLTITFVPARHWSMRMPWNRNDTLWGGFVIGGPEGVVYHSGDTAWGDHFAEIGARFHIDWAMLPIGAYSPRWFMESQHIDPEEAGRAFRALRAKRMLAMHWGTFRLTDEAIGEPVERMRAWWAQQALEADRLWILDVGEARPLWHASLL